VGLQRQGAGPAGGPGGGGPRVRPPTAGAGAPAGARPLPPTARRAVSAGIYGWPLDDAARIAVRTIGEASRHTRLDEARFVLLGTDAYTVFSREVTTWSHDRSQ